MANGEQNEKKRSAADAALDCPKDIEEGVKGFLDEDVLSPVTRKHMKKLSQDINEGKKADKSEWCDRFELLKHSADKSAKNDADSTKRAEAEQAEEVLKGKNKALKGKNKALKGENMALKSEVLDVEIKHQHREWLLDVDDWCCRFMAELKSIESRAVDAENQKLLSIFQNHALDDFKQAQLRIDPTFQPKTDYSGKEKDKMLTENVARSADYKRHKSWRALSDKVSTTIRKIKLEVKLVRVWRAGGMTATPPITPYLLRIQQIIEYSKSKCGISLTFSWIGEVMQMYARRNKVAHNPPLAAHEKFIPATNKVDWASLQQTGKEAAVKWQGCRASGYISEAEANFGTRISNMWSDFAVESWSGATPKLAAHGNSKTSEVKNAYNKKAAIQGKTQAPEHKSYTWPYEVGQWDDILPPNDPYPHVWTTQ